MPRHAGAITKPRLGSATCLARLLFLFSWLLPLALLPPAPAFADREAFVCPPGNLLAGARVIDSLDVDGPSRAVADDSVLANELAWRYGRAIRFRTMGGSLTYDLGRETPIAAAYIQASTGNA